MGESLLLEGPSSARAACRVDADWSRGREGGRVEGLFNFSSAWWRALPCFARCPHHASAAMAMYKAVGGAE